MGKLEGKIALITGGNSGRYFGIYGSKGVDKAVIIGGVPGDGCSKM